MFVKIISEIGHKWQLCMPFKVHSVLDGLLKTSIKCQNVEIGIDYISHGM